VPDPPGVTIRKLEPGDEPSLVRCVVRCYGDGYPHRAFYDADEIRRLLSRELLHSAVAVDGEGEVVAHLGVVLERRGSRTADMVLGIVDSRFRGHTLSVRVGIVLAQEFQRLGLIGLYMYATTAHAISQKLTLANSSIETGVLLGYLPEATSSMQRPSDPPGWRIPSIMLYLPLAEAPARTAYVPERYREVASDIYARAGLERRLVEAGSSLPDAPTRLRSVLDTARSLARVVIETAGTDLVSAVSEALRDVGSSAADIVHIDLRISDPSTPESAEMLRQLGFFFGGVLPELRDGDVIRLQSTTERPHDRSTIEVVSEVSEGLLDFVLADQEAALAESQRKAAVGSRSKPQGTSGKTIFEG
jgi:serine/threonine-protein kinase RsbW